MGATTNFTADEILKCTSRDAAKIFSGPPKDIKSRFRDLARRWHPDQSRHPQASAIFQKLMELRDAALAAGGAGGQKMVSMSAVTFRDKSGREFSLKYFSTHPTDLGDVYVAGKTVTYHFKEEVADLAQKEEAVIGQFEFFDTSMKEQMKPYLPRLVGRRDLEDGSVLLIYERKAREAMLIDALAKYGSFDPKHAAWICSSLLNIASWMTLTKLVHGAISAENIMVNLDTHELRLIGGWGFATEEGERPTALPNRTLSALPALGIKTTMAEFSHDLELTRKTVLEVLGDPSGVNLRQKSVPEPIINWLVLPPSASNGMEDYSNWQKALLDGWGKREFVVFDGSAQDLYKNLGATTH